MLYGNTYKKWEVAQKRMCHYDLFSQTARLKQARSERKLFCFHGASCNLHWDQSTFSVVQHSICLHSWQWRVAQQHIQKALLCFYWNNGYANAPQWHGTRTLPILFRLLVDQALGQNVLREWMVLVGERADLNIRGGGGLKLLQPRYPLCRMLGGPQGRSGWTCRRGYLLPHQEFEPPTVQLVVSR
jgi:hypothetical protein